MRYYGWLLGMLLGMVVIFLIPGEQPFLLAVVLGIVSSGFGYLIGMSAERSNR